MGRRKLGYFSNWIHAVCLNFRYFATFTRFLATLTRFLAVFYCNVCGFFFSVFSKIFETVAGLASGDEDLSFSAVRPRRLGKNSKFSQSSSAAILGTDLMSPLPPQLKGTFVDKLPSWSETSKDVNPPDAYLSVSGKATFI